MSIFRLWNGQLSDETIADLVTTLRHGGIGVLPFDTVYGLVAKAFQTEAWERMNRIKGQRLIPFVVVFNSLAAARNWYGGFDLIREKVLARLLPGPVSLILPFKEGISEEFRYPRHGFGVRVCSDGILGRIIAELGEPLWATSTNRHGEPAPFLFSDIQSAILEEVDFAVDDGPTPFRQATSVVDLRARPFTIQRQGPWQARIASVLKEAEKIVEVLVVCTGNTCRSPLAERLLQKEVGAVSESGIRVTSAGTAAPPGNPASQEMVEIGELWGVDLSDHTAQPLDSELVAAADLILALEPRHALRIRDLYPNSAGKIRLLGELIDEPVISDPFGLTRIEYRATAELIRKATTKWGEHLAASVPPPAASAESHGESR